MNAGCVVAVLDAGINADIVNSGNYLPEISFNPDVEISAALRAHGTDVCNTILKMAPEATLLPLQITNEFGQLNTPLLETALDWILQHHRQMNIRIICAAFADYTHHISDADFADSKIYRQIALLKEQGVMMVAAAGNWYASFKDKAAQGMAWPAIIKTVVSVGALDADGRIAACSQRLNSNKNTDCATTVFTITNAPGDTSGATAVVAGALAGLYLKQPELTVSELMKQFASALQLIEEDGDLWSAYLYNI